MKDRELIFVYNAESGLFNSLSDFARKIISPETYQCSLCALTFGNFQMKREWKKFLEELNVPCHFWYKDAFENPGLSGLEFPAILLKSPSETKVLMQPSELANCASLPDLMDRIRKKLAGEV